MEGQTTQWPKKGTKGRKNSLQNTTQKTKDRATRTTQNNRSGRRCYGRVSTSSYIDISLFVCVNIQCIFIQK